MKALTLRQPYASLVSLGVKTIETRSWSTRYRGPLAIHAGKRRADGADMKRLVGDEVDAWNAWHAAGLVTEDGSLDRMPYGALVAVCQVLDVLPMVPRCPSVSPEFDPYANTHRVFVDTDQLWRTNPRGGPPVALSDQIPFGVWQPGLFAWMLGDIERLAEPIPAVGRQGLWTWNE